MHNNKSFGKLGEEAATNHLIENGYYIFAKNYNCRFGEIDIIAIDKKNNRELVFVEVKSRSQDKYGTPVDAVNRNKIRRMYKTAECFIVANHLENSYMRFDVIEIYEKADKMLHINHLKNVINSQNEI